VPAAFRDGPTVAPGGGQLPGSRLVPSHGGQVRSVPILAAPPNRRHNRYNYDYYRRQRHSTSRNVDFALQSAEEILPQLGARIRQRRLAQQLSQARLAQMAGVSLGTLRTLECSGASSLESTIRIAQALGLSAQLQTLFEAPAPLSIQQVLEQSQAPVRLRAPPQRRP
jgi:DNA-binding XRE family transcriptional regulator